MLQIAVEKTVALHRGMILRAVVENPNRTTVSVTHALTVPGSLFSHSLHSSEFFLKYRLSVM